jgi:L-threonylcarbamoyladenylate synthase
VLRELGDSVELVLDAGPCEAGIESTVVDVRGSQPCLLRPGAIDLRALRAVMADVSRGEAAALIRDQLRPSPGMQARHYSPRAILRVARDRDSAEALAASLSAEGEYVGLLVRGPLSKPASPRVESRQLAQDPKAFAHSLFATLHDLDALGVNAIVVEDVPGEDEWLAVADRLTRAACPR